MNINIDKHAGFCWGVVQTINRVENLMEENINKQIYVLGEIIHNPHEIQRLRNKNLKTIEIEQLQQIAPQNSIIIIRAHGEPPSTYNLIEQNQLNLVDATCLLVKRLQSQIKKYYDEGWQIIIFGKYNHPEVVGLRGVCDNQCIIVQNNSDKQWIDFYKKSVLFSQTTMNADELLKLYNELMNDFEKNKIQLVLKNSICKFMFNRKKKLKEFATNNDVMLFVAGKQSSNGKVLFNICKSANEQTFFIEEMKEIDKINLNGAINIGITGATSTPMWYLIKIKERLLLNE